jgi:hypothetical protein
MYLYEIESEPTNDLAKSNLQKMELDNIRTFNFIVQTNLPSETYRLMKPAFPERLSDLPSLHTLRTRITALSGMKPRNLDCCVNTCCCFYGYLDDLTTCPYCQEARWDAHDRPRNTFTFLPLIPQLQSLFRCKETCEKMLYRDDYVTDPENIRDIFDADRYCGLCETNVVIDGVEQPYKYFEDEGEVALGMSTDGFCPFKRRKITCWPIIFFNYNLHPDIRTHLVNLLCIGVIPGPSAPKDMNSFLQPLIEELLELARGVKTVDVRRKKYFALRAHLIAIFGDIPAVSKLLEFLGHNGRFPCRFCNIEGVVGKTSKGGHHIYCPLYRPNNNSYNPHHLPLRTHTSTINQGERVLAAATTNARKRLATATGVKGVTILARLPSVSIPDSFPIDVMHMVMINLIPHLVKLWTGKFQGLDSGTENYVFLPKLWEKIAAIGATSGDHTPVSFGGRIPNVHTKKSSLTAEVWSLWGQHLAPILLRRRFVHDKFYRHFLDLIKYVKMASELSIRRVDLAVLREGLAQWVIQYEK